MGQAFTTMRMFVDESWPPKPKFGVDDIPDLTGKVIIVTGGYTGVGYETVKPLLVKNAKVYIAARSKSEPERGEEGCRRVCQARPYQSCSSLIDLGY